MPRPPRHDSAALQTLERHRQSLLQEARALQSRAEAFLATAEAACGESERLLESALAAQRARAATGAPIDTHDLRRAQLYVLARAAKVVEARAARDRRRRELVAAQEELAARLKDMKAIERLRQRLRRAQAKWDLRRDQSRLDGLGIIKRAIEEAPWR